MSDDAVPPGEDQHLIYVMMKALNLSNVGFLLVPSYGENGTGLVTPEEHDRIQCESFCAPESCESLEETVQCIRDFIFPTPLEWLFICLHVVLFMVGVLGNLLVCFVVLRSKHMQTVTNLFIVNLAGADAVLLILCSPPSVLQSVTETWWLGGVMCKVVIFFQVSDTLGYVFIFFQVSDTLGYVFIFFQVSDTLGYVFIFFQVSDTLGYVFIFFQVSDTLGYVFIFFQVSDTLGYVFIFFQVSDTLGLVVIFFQVSGTLGLVVIFFQVSDTLGLIVIFFQVSGTLGLVVIFF